MSIAVSYTHLPTSLHVVLYLTDLLLEFITKLSQPESTLLKLLCTGVLGLGTLVKFLSSNFEIFVLNLETKILTAAHGPTAWYIIVLVSFLSLIHI